MDLSALFGGGAMDPLALLDLTFRNVIDLLAKDEHLVAQGRTPEDLIASAFADRIARLVVSNEAVRPDAPEPAEPFAPGGAVELVERNVELAAALGACECWGETDGCARCHGAGAPGWQLPDRELFPLYVYPAVQAVAEQQRSSAAGADVNSNHQKENGHVHVRHLTR